MLAGKHEVRVKISAHYTLFYAVLVVHAGVGEQDAVALGEELALGGQGLGFVALGGFLRALNETVNSDLLVAEALFEGLEAEGAEAVEGALLAG